MTERKKRQNISVEVFCYLGDISKSNYRWNNKKQHARGGLHDDANVEEVEFTGQGMALKEPVGQYDMAGQLVGAVEDVGQ